MLADAARHRSKSSPKSAGQMPPRRLQRARDYIRAHFAERLALETVAGEVGVHPAHLAREFRRTYGCSIGQAVRRLRVDAACRALSTSNLSLASIAAAAGFADQSHFTRVFRSLTGITPLDYRRSLQCR